VWLETTPNKDTFPSRGNLPCPRGNAKKHRGKIQWKKDIPVGKRGKNLTGKNFTLVYAGLAGVAFLEAGTY
jgi:hypothetical protein